MSRIATDDVLGSLCKLRTRESDQLKTLLELYELEIDQMITKQDYQKLKTMVKRSVDPKVISRNYQARKGRTETGAVVKNCRDQRGVARGQG